MGRLKPINIPFDTGWNFVQCGFDNVIYSTLLLFTMFWNIMRNTSKRIQVLVNNACITTWDLLPKWNTTPLLQRQVKKRCKGSHGAGKYSWNLCASKNSCLNERNFKSGRYNRMERKVSTLQPTSVHRKAHKICQRVTLAQLSNHGLQVKTRSAEEYKFPPPRRLCQMIWAVSCRKDTER